MNNLKYMIYALAAMLLVSVSCSKESDYTPGAAESTDCYDVYFPEMAATKFEFAPEDTKTIEVTVKRSKLDGALTVPLDLTTTPEAPFTVTDAVFEDGQGETTVTVTVPETAETGLSYKVEVGVSDPKYALIYGLNPTNAGFTAMVVKWNAIEGAVYQDELWTYTIGALDMSPANPYATKTFTIYERDDKPGYYKVVNLYTDEYLAEILGTSISGIYAYESEMYIDATNPNKVWFDYSEVGLNLAQYGACIIALDVPEVFGADSYVMYGVMSENGVIRFPDQSIYLGYANLGKLAWIGANTAFMIPQN